MVLASFGCAVSIGRIRQLCRPHSAGTDAQAILEAAETFGLHGRGFAVAADSIGVVPHGSIVHFPDRNGEGHFVVLESSPRGIVRMLDPLKGRMSISTLDFHKCFSGTVLCVLCFEKIGKATPRSGQASKIGMAPARVRR